MSEGTAHIPLRLSARARAFCYSVAMAVFFVGIIMSLRASPLDLRTVQVAQVALLGLVLTPAQILLNAWEFRITSRMQSATFSFSESMKVTVAGSIANYLPIPGAMMARVAALKLRGVPLSRATLYTVFSFAILAGLSFLYAGIWIWSLGTTTVASIHFAVVGGIAVVIALFLRHQRIASRNALDLVANRLCCVTLDGIRIYVAVIALGGTTQFGQAAALATTTVLGLAVPIVPAGLGVRELASSLLAPVVGAVGAEVFLGTSLIRLIDLAALGVVSLAAYRPQRALA